MSYLAITKYAAHQHYKDRKPPWIKFYVSLLDPHHPMNDLPIPTRYLFDRLLLLAAEYDNAIPNDFELIAKLLRMPPRACREGIAQLLKGRWIQEKKTRRSASKSASRFAPRFERQRQRQSKKRLTHTSTVDGPKRIGDGNELVLSRLFDVIGPLAPSQHQAIATAAQSLPEGRVAKVTESLMLRGSAIRDRASYALSALRSEAA